MKWLSDCINSLYSSEYTKEPISIAPLPALALPEVIPIQCQGCVKPCAHPLVPSHLKIDQSKPLENTVPSYAIHIIVMTGKTDWVSHIEDEGLAQAIIEGLQQRKDERTPENTYHPAYTDADSNNIHGNRVIVTNSSLPSKYSTHRGAQDIILLPDNIIIANITNRRINALLDYIYGKPCNQPFSIHPCPFTNLVLICGHGRKDRRCGTVGPMLQQALLQALPDQKESVQVALVSHLGGHAFAGNMVIYTHSGHRAIWYGRVTPCDCKEIVENTLQDDKILEGLVRGIFEVKTDPKKCQSLEW